MVYVMAFISCGLICMIAQMIYDHSNWSFGHITSLFVTIGALLESFDIYDKWIEVAGMGAQLPILSFGHSLAHASYQGALHHGWIGVVSGVFDKTSSGIAFAIFMAFMVAIFFKPKS